MSKRIRFGEKQKPPSQRDRCLKIAGDLKAKEPDTLIVPSVLTNACIKARLFPLAQLKSFRFEGAKRLVEQWLKTPDKSGLAMWGQLPLITKEGEHAWEPRSRMKLEGYAWNYLLRDNLVVSNTIVRDRWKDEALFRWTEPAFNAVVEQLRIDREDRQEGSTDAEDQDSDGVGPEV